MEIHNEGTNIIAANNKLKMSLEESTVEGTIEDSLNGINEAYEAQLREDIEEQKVEWAGFV